MKFKQLDLNLLRVLVALYRTRSVTNAGNFLALSQPATSHLLARLRDSFGDELFIRTPRGLRPTPFCERIAPFVQNQLAELESALTGEQAFDPAIAQINWRVSLSDLGEMMFLPDLAATLRQLAPQSTISNISVTAQEMPAALEAREIDLAIGILHSDHKNVEKEMLFEERYVAMSSQSVGSSKATGTKKLSMSQLRKSKFVIASPTATFQGGIEKILAEHKLADQIMLRTRHFGAIPELTSRTDLLAIVPTMYAKSLTNRFGFQIWELPIRSLKYTVNLLWHNSTNSDISHMWIRQRIREIFAVQNQAGSAKM